MNTYPINDFCKFDSFDALDNYIKYLVKLNNQLPQSDKDTIAAGIGYKYDKGVLDQKSFSITNFYTFWKERSNAINLANIVREFGSRVLEGNTTITIYQSCVDIRNYTYAILQVFFCNIIPFNLETPVLGKLQQECLLQKENIYNYFGNFQGLNVGGYGLAACVPSNVGSDADKNTIESVMKTFCTSMMPTSVPENQQSLYISSNQDIYKWCGCYVSPTDFAVVKAGISSNCSPLCTNPESIQLYQYADPKSSTQVTSISCDQTICAIDEVSIKNLDDQGNINFNQICKGCADGGNCTCIIDNSVQGILDKIITEKGGTQNQVNFKQVCPNAECFLFDPRNKSYKELTCNTNNASNTNKDPVLGYSGNGFLRNISEEEKFTSTNYVVFILFCLIFIIFILVSLLSITEIEFFRYKNRNRVAVPNSPVKNDYGSAKDMSFLQKSKVQ